MPFYSSSRLQPFSSKHRPLSCEGDIFALGPANSYICLQYKILCQICLEFLGTLIMRHYYSAVNWKSAISCLENAGKRRRERGIHILEQFVLLFSYRKFHSNPKAHVSFCHFLLLCIHSCFASSHTLIILFQTYSSHVI